MKWKLGDIADIGVYVHWSFWILLSTLTGGMLLLVALFVFLAAQAELTMARMHGLSVLSGGPFS